MIPYEQLASLKPLPDQVKRMKALKHQRKIPAIKFHLTKKQRRFAFHQDPRSGYGGYGGPNNYRKDRL